MSGLACAGGAGFVLGWALIEGSAVGRCGGFRNPQKISATVNFLRVGGRTRRQSGGGACRLAAKVCRRGAVGGRRGVDCSPPGDLSLTYAGARGVAVLVDKIGTETYKSMELLRSDALSNPY